MATAEFMAIVDAFVYRETQDCGELPATVFYDALENIFSKPAGAMTVELEAQVVGSELQFALPDIAIPSIEIHHNEIMVNMCALLYACHQQPLRNQVVIFM